MLLVMEFETNHREHLVGRADYAFSFKKDRFDKALLDFIACNISLSTLEWRMSETLLD